jgi:predicted  nucleic acid-binding Zn-ribbon protein
MKWLKRWWLEMWLHFYDDEIYEAVQTKLDANVRHAKHLQALDHDIWQMTQVRDKLFDELAALDQAYMAGRTE